MTDPKFLNQSSEGMFPALLGINTTQVSASELRAEMLVPQSHLAPNGYLHAGSVVSLADTTCGHGCVANLPEGATGFTTIELKSNHLGTVREGIVECIATPSHQGRSTQVWDAVVSCKESGKKIAIFRCTQMILYPKGS